MTLKHRFRKALFSWNISRENADDFAKDIWTIRAETKRDGYIRAYAMRCKSPKTGWDWLLFTAKFNLFQCYIQMREWL